MAIVLALALSALLSACTQPSSEPTTTSTAGPSTPAASPTPTPTPTQPVLVPDGTAEENLPLFAQVVETVWASPGRVSGRAYIDALVAAGFDKAAMQVTNDQTTIGDPAESIQFSVLWDDECLIGQVGPATGEPVAVIVPALAEGGCLIGNTRPIDW
nr:hypothetical protein [Microbacterium immunditiarum]